MVMGLFPTAYECKGQPRDAQRCRMQTNASAAVRRSRFRCWLVQALRLLVSRTHEVRSCSRHVILLISKYQYDVSSNPLVQSSSQSCRKASVKTWASSHPRIRQAANVHHNAFFELGFKSMNLYHAMQLQHAKWQIVTVAITVRFGLACLPIFR